MRIQPKIERRPIAFQRVVWGFPVEAIVSLTWLRAGDAASTDGRSNSASGMEEYFWIGEEICGRLWRNRLNINRERPARKHARTAVSRG
jgi:hypothetical protein